MHGILTIRSRLALYVVIGTGLAVASGFAITAGFPWVSMAAVAWVAFLMVVAALTSEQIAARDMAVDATMTIVRVARNAGISLTRRIRSGGRKSRVSAISAQGACPLGLQIGATWEIGRGGGLDRPLCRPAAQAIERLMRGNTSSTDAIACVCPRGPQNITFAIDDT